MIRLSAAVGAVLVTLLISACGPMAAPTPVATIVRVPEETRSFIATAQAAAVLSAPATTTPSVPTVEAATGTTPAGAAVATAATDGPAPTITSVATGKASPTVGPAGASTPPSPTEHIVALGENLTMIARRYGVTVADIAAANGIANPSQILVGQRLIIPAPGTMPSAAPRPAATLAATAQALAPPPPAERLMGRIAFQVASGGDIYVANADGSSLARLTSGIDPSWSPDGATLAFTRWTVPWGIYLVSADGTNERLVLQQNLARSPSWSPDGQKLVFTRQTAGVETSRLCLPGRACVDLPGKDQWHLGLMNLDGTGREDPPGDLRSSAPDWSTDGYILYTGEAGLRRTRLGEAPSFVVDDVAAAFPSASPDGSRVAFMYHQHDHWEVFAANRDGSGLTELTSSPVFSERRPNNVAPEWSPDGTRILFLSDRDGPWRPYIMLADGTGQQPFLPEALSGLQFRYEYAAERVFSWH